MEMKKGKIEYSVPYYAPLEEPKNVVVLTREEFDALQNKILYWVKRAQRAEDIIMKAHKDMLEWSEPHP